MPKNNNASFNRLIIGIAAIWLITTTIAIGLFIDSNSEDLSSWVTDDSAVRKQYDEFVATFGIDDVLLIAWPGCDIHDTRLTSFEQLLNQPEKNLGLIDVATSGQSIVQEMARQGIGPKSTGKRFKHIYFGNDKTTTCLIVKLSESGYTQRHNVIELIKRFSEAVQGLEWQDIFIAGPCYTAVAMDEATNRNTNFLLPSCLLGTILTFCFFPSIRLVLPILITASLASINGIGLLVITGEKVNSLLILTPPFVMVLTISGCIHLVHYFLDELNTHDWDMAVRRATRIAIKPCSLSVLTTSVALFSLCASQIQAVRLFGFYTAIALIFALLYTLLLLPAMLQLARPTNTQSMKRRTLPLPVWLPRLWRSAKIRRTILAAIIIIFVASTFGLFQSSAVFLDENMFSKESRIYRSAKWFSKNIGDPNSLHMTVMIDTNLAPNLIDELDAVWSVQKAVHRMNDVRSTFSIANFVGLPPGKANPKQIFKRSVLQKRLAQNKSLLKKNAMRVVSGESVLWRIRIGLGDIGPAEYGNIIRKLDATIEQATLHRSIQNTSYTSMFYIISFSQNALFSELAKSFLLAFLIITPVMAIVLKGVVPGLVSMLPNVAPTLILFGAMGLFEMPISVGSILTATVGLGIAVDDTLHFLCRFRDFKLARMDGNLNQIIDQTVAKCYAPMTQTSLICSASLIIFGFASFLPIQQFGMTIAALMMLALAADLLLLPVILASPLGNRF